MVVASAHHGVDRGLHVLAGVCTCVGVGHRDQEVVHQLLGHLLARGVLNVPSSCACTVFGVIVLVVFCFRTVFDTEVSEPVELLASWPIVISQALRAIVVELLRNDAHCVDLEGEVLLQVCAGQDLELQGWDRALFRKLLQHHFAAFHGAGEVVLDFLVVKDVEALALIRSTLLLLSVVLNDVGIVWVGLLIGPLFGLCI